MELTPGEVRPDEAQPDEAQLDEVQLDEVRLDEAQLDEVRLDGKYKTRKGLPVRIYAVDCGGPYPVHGAMCIGTQWLACTWTSVGKAIAGITHNEDLVLAPEKLSGWVNVYRDNRGYLSVQHFKSKELADVADYCNRIACIDLSQFNVGHEIKRKN